MTGLSVAMISVVTLCAGVRAADAAGALGQDGQPATQTAASGDEGGDPGLAREAIKDGGYPWYDAEADRIRPVWPARNAWLKELDDRIEKISLAIARWLNRLFGGFGSGGSPREAIGTILLVAALAAFLVLLIFLALKLSPSAWDRSREEAKVGTSARLAELPEGLRPTSGDPWAEALARFQAGDLAGAVVCLFAHQLLRLDQLGLIRIVPGRTGRQYVKGLRDPELLDSVAATLALFETVYYGQRAPSAAAFEQVWNRAQSFQRRTAALAAGNAR